MTVVEMTESAAMDPIVFTSDRPFLFMIAEDETDTILFLGKFANAESTEFLGSGGVSNAI